MLLDPFPFTPAISMITPGAASPALPRDTLTGHKTPRLATRYALEVPIGPLNAVPMEYF